MVLSFIVLISILVVGFFSSVSTELVGAKTYASSVTTQQLSETAVNVVMGQIRTATTLENGAWASQPGMIRVYRSGNNADFRADSFFKLYSSENMVLKDSLLSQFDPAKETVENWRELPSLYTNLNEPVLVTDQSGAPAKKRYPIIDPSWAADSPYDPNAKIEGFAITPDGNPDVDRGRMPARWIYVLKDGTLTVPQADPSGLAVWDNASGAPVPTPGNPIVGRIAFWTDDESSKVNINTAGGFVVPRGANEESFAGSYWDMPRAFTAFDRGELEDDGTVEVTGNIKKPGLSASQPAQGEFQRYPGHPATTSVGLIFRDLFTNSPEQLYKFLPRLTPGGSEGGTARPTAPLDPEAPYKRRLYASVDELLFTQNNPGNTPSATDWRRPTTNDALLSGEGDAKLSPEQVDQLRFFLTAHGRSSDLNLFGQPRVALWPISQDNNATTGLHRTPYDRLIAFCASLPGKAYYWRRHDPYSSTAEYTYKRNQELYEYLFKLTGKPVPGVGKPFGGDTAPKGKYGRDRDQILTEMVDYIRTVNLRHSEIDKNYYSPNGLVVPLRIESPHKVQTKGFGRMPTITEAALVFYHGGENPAKTHKLLRAFLILEHFTPAYGYAGLKDPVNGARNQMVVHEITGLNQFRVSEANGSPKFLEFPSEGTNVIERRSAAHWHGRDPGGPEGFFHLLMPGSKKAPFPAPPAGSTISNSRSGLMPGEYPFQSSKIGVEFPKNAETFRFYGGKITIKLSVNADAPKLLQTFEVNFPDSGVEWPFPRDEPQFCHQTDKGGFFQNAYDDRSDPEKKQFPTLQDIRHDFPARLRWAERTSGDATPTGGHNHTNRWRQIIQPGDVVRSVEIGGANVPKSYRGDVRLMLLEDTVTVSQPHSRYHNENYFKAYSIRTAAGALYDDGPSPDGKVVDGKRIGMATFGQLVATPTAYPSDKASDIPDYLKDGVKRADNKPGDWDTGMGSFADGAYINKADEGNVQYNAYDSNLKKYVKTHPYFSWNDSVVGETYFSPNRIMPSAVMFGSLPSRVIARGSWETLAFAPHAAGEKHRGNTVDPKDHLLLDLFTMPIVEPYAISEPCSTAGRVNLNYQIMPYTHIHRSSALRAALQSLRIMAVPGVDVGRYKSGSGGQPLPTNYRHLVDRDETVKSFEYFFSKFAGDKHTGFFKSATEICDRYLYPRGVKFQDEDSTIKTWWLDKTLTGDNTREKPYADLYPRVTTKSNTYTVHMRVQTLSQGAGLSKDPSQYLRWEERPDAIMGEYRGSTTIERYIDPNDRRFNKDDPETKEMGDFVNPDIDSIEGVHRFRVIGVKRFAP